MTARTAESIRPWPDGVVTKGVTREFIAAYRAAFDADQLATFCAGEIDGLTIVVAVGARGRELRDFVEAEWDGMIQRAISTAHIDGAARVS